MRTLMAVVFLVFLAGGLIAWMPLSAPLRLLEPPPGAGWQQARGTIWDGQITGLEARGVPLGQVALEGSALSALDGRPDWRAQLAGPMATGTAALELRPLAAPLQIALSDAAGRGAVPDAALPEGFRGLGAELRLRAGRLVMGADGRCLEASGMLSTDLVARAGQRAGEAVAPEGWPELSGPLLCEDGRLGAELSGEAEGGEVFTLELRAAPGGALTGLAAVDGAAGPLLAALSQAGFTRVSATRFEHRIDTQAASGGAAPSSAPAPANTLSPAPAPAPATGPDTP